MGDEAGGHLPHAPVYVPLLPHDWHGRQVNALRQYRNPPGRVQIQCPLKWGRYRYFRSSAVKGRGSIEGKHYLNSRSKVAITVKVIRFVTINVSVETVLFFIIFLPQLIKKFQSINVWCLILLWLWVVQNYSTRRTQDVICDLSCFGIVYIYYDLNFSGGLFHQEFLKLS